METHKLKIGTLSTENIIPCSDTFYAICLNYMLTFFLLQCKFTSSVGKYNPELKIYFPGIDTPTTNEGFSPSVVVVCQFQGSKF